MPVSKRTGDPVFAATINQTGGLEVRVTKLAKDSTIEKLIRMVEEAQSEKAETQRFLDRAAIPEIEECHRLGATQVFVVDDNFIGNKKLAKELQQTQPAKLFGVLKGLLDRGTDLRQLVAAGAVANTRAFAGQDYDGYHTFMALPPAYAMAQELPAADRALPVFKVLYRNAQQIQSVGGASKTTLAAMHDAEHATTGDVVYAEVLGEPFSGGPVGDCVARKLRNAHLPPFSGEARTLETVVRLGE